MSNVQVKILSPQSESAFVSGWYELANDSHFWMKGRLAAVLKQFKRNHIPFDRNLRGMEIGCGHGVLRAQIENNTQWTVDGCDLDHASLKNNKQLRGDVYLYNIFDRAHFLKEYYDFIILYDVIEHIENVKIFMDAALYHLKPGGYVFINVPALNSLYSRYDKVVGHCRRYDKEMMVKELTDCGLNIVHMNYWGFSFLPVLQLRKKILESVEEEKIVQKGFRPPGKFANGFLNAVIHAEVALMPNPISGTSLMAIAQKSDKVN